MSDVTNTMSGDAAKDAIDEAMTMSTSRPLDPDSFLELMNVEDRFMKRFWGNLHSGAPITVDGEVLHWLGYTGITKTQRNSFRHMLDELVIPYDLDLEEELADSCAAARPGPPAEWVVLSGVNFKLACLSVRTTFSRDITRFFVVLEHAVRTYGDYIKQYEARASTRKDEERQYDHDSQLKDVEARHEMQVKMLREDLHSARQIIARSGKRLGEARAHLRAKAARSVPPAAEPSREEKLVLMRMSANYTSANTDPAYMRDCTLLFIRSQCGLLDARKKKVCAFGDGTNKDAEVCHAIDTPNAKALFAAFKHLASDRKVVCLCMYGGKQVGDIRAVIELMKMASNQKFDGVYDEDEDDGDDELGEY